MKAHSRRQFLAAGSMAIAAGMLDPKFSLAASHSLPIGLQLYSVRQMLPNDFAGTLKQLATIGYRQVEAAGFFGHSASEVRQMMADAGIKCVSAHYSLVDLLKTGDATIEYAKALGLEYVVCSAPSAPDPERLAKYPGGTWQGVLHALTLDDWKWNADQFNQMGRRMKAAGIRFGYHNHTGEFRNLDGTNGFQVLLRDTDPAYVTFELDCGWAIASGQDPITLLRQNPTRFSLLHVKDLKPASADTAPDKRISTELGRGIVDYRPIFAAAISANIHHAFIEQEDFDIPVLDALKIDFDTMQALESGKPLGRSAS
jgi:sugar phosphate isomerase/epimerase